MLNSEEEFPPGNQRLPSGKVIGPYNYSTFVYFDSEQAFLDEISGPDSLYSFDPAVKIYSSAVIFDAGYPSWHYTIRMNKTYYNLGFHYHPDTFGPNVDISVRSNNEETQRNANPDLPFNQAYAYSGQLTLMSIVHRY